MTGSLPCEFESSENAICEEEKSVGPCESLTIEKPKERKIHYFTTNNHTFVVIYKETLACV